jgi:hypothetical protein
MNPQITQTIKVLRPWILLAVAVAVALIVCWGVAPRFPEDGLDPSWEQALVDATDQKRIFGTDVIFSFGPLHQALTAQVSRDWSAFLVGRILFSLCWFFVVLLAGRLVGLRMAFAIALAVSLTEIPEVHFYLLAFLGVVLGYRLHDAPHPASWGGIGLAGVLAAGCVLSTLVKLSFVGAAVPALLVLLGLPVLKVILGREPLSLRLGTLILAPPVLLMLVWGVTVNWSPRSLLEYFLGANLEIVKGYSNAMASPYSALERILLGIYFVLTVWALGLFWKLQARADSWRIRIPMSLPLAAGIAFFALGLLFWVVGKASFVRPDYIHTRIATFWVLGVFAVLITMPAARLWEFIQSHSRTISAIVLLVPFCLGALLIPSSGEDLGLRWIKHRLTGSLENLQWFTVTGRQAAVASRDAAFARIREHTEDFGIPRGATADILPWHISRLLANELRYTPRPIPQSYAVFTPALQRLNREFILTAPTRPEYVIVSVEDIDERLPIGLDSPLLLQLRAGYDLHHVGNQGSLVFRRRDGEAATAGPRGNIVTSGSLTWSRRYRYLWSSSEIPLPSSRSGPLVLRAQFSEGASRLILSKAFRPFPVQIEYLDRHGKVVEKARFIPEAAEEMLVHPLVRTNDDFLQMLYPGRPQSLGSSVGEIVALRFTVKDFGRPFVKTDFSLLEYNFGP